MRFDRPIAKYIEFVQPLHKLSRIKYDNKYKDYIMKGNILATSFIIINICYTSSEGISVEINKKDWNLLVRKTFFTYFCRSTDKMKEYEHKTKKIYPTRR